jgi:hypothetical protein
MNHKNRLKSEPKTISGVMRVSAKKQGGLFISLLVGSAALLVFDRVQDVLSASDTVTYDEHGNLPGFVYPELVKGEFTEMVSFFSEHGTASDAISSWVSLSEEMLGDGVGCISCHSNTVLAPLDASVYVSEDDFLRARNMLAGQLDAIAINEPEWLVTNDWALTAYLYTEMHVNGGINPDSTILHAYIDLQRSDGCWNDATTDRPGPVAGYTRFVYPRMLSNSFDYIPRPALNCATPIDLMELSRLTGDREDAVLAYESLVDFDLSALTYAELGSPRASVAGHYQEYIIETNHHGIDILPVSTQNSDIIATKLAEIVACQVQVCLAGEFLTSDLNPRYFEKMKEGYGNYYLMALDYSLTACTSR